MPMPSSTASSTTPTGSISPVTVCDVRALQKTELRKPLASLRRYMRARRSRLAPSIALPIDRPPTECNKLAASKAPDPGDNHVGTPGDFISECPGDFIGISTKPSQRRNFPLSAHRRSRLRDRHDQRHRGENFDGCFRSRRRLRDRAFEAHATGMALADEPEIMPDPSSQGSRRFMRIREENEKAAAAAAAQGGRRGSHRDRARPDDDALAELRPVRADRAPVRPRGRRRGRAGRRTVGDAGRGRRARIRPPTHHGALHGLKLDRIMVCWDGSRPVARAVADAMPLLHRAAQMDVAIVEQGKSDEMPGADVAEHLARRSAGAPPTVSDNKKSYPPIYLCAKRPVPPSQEACRGLSRGGTADGTFGPASRPIPHTALVRRPSPPLEVWGPKISSSAAAPGEPAW
jgi:hypothetical protein